MGVGMVGVDVHGGGLARAGGGGAVGDLDAGGGVLLDGEGQ